jgi:tetratricopeptide (TPR) repeat protein
MAPRWVIAMVFASLVPLCAQDSKPDQTPPAAEQKPGELKKERPQPAVSDKEEIPPEEDGGVANEEFSFNPLQSKHELERGEFYEKTKKNYRAAANRYIRATKYNDGNSEAWLKLGEAEEKLHDGKAARDAYTKYLALEPDAKKAAEIKKKLERLK